MATTLISLVAGIVLFSAGRDAAFVAPLTPVWSKPLGKDVRLVGVEEYGRCILFADHGAIRVVLPTGETAWSWPYSKVSRYINPRRVAVSHECDAIAVAGDASYKYVWIVTRDGHAVPLAFAATPADAAFDRQGAFVAVGTYARSLYLYSRSGDLQWKRETDALIVSDLDFTDDNQQIVFRNWGGAGVVRTDGQVVWSTDASRLAAARDLSTFVVGQQPNHGPGLPTIEVMDGRRQVLWRRYGLVDAHVSADGQRILATIDDRQEKSGDDEFDPDQQRTPRLASRDGETIATFAGFSDVVAIAGTGSHVWLRSGTRLVCADETGQTVAEIALLSEDWSRVMFTRNAHVAVTNEDYGRSRTFEWYEVPSVCGK